jgi:phytoene dehydrogenase-like protein
LYNQDVISFGESAEGDARIDPFNFYVHHPRTSDPSVVDKGHDIMTVLVPFSHLRYDEEKVSASDYEKIPDEVLSKYRESILLSLNKACGGEPLNVVWEEIKQPRDWATDFNLPGGAVFGASHGLGQLSIFRQKKEIAGVNGGFYVGACTTPGNGVPLVMIGAQQTAALVKKHLSALRPSPR